MTQVEPSDPKYADALQRLLTIMNELRAGCPWDQKQTLESLRHLTIEETYELSDAIMSKNLDEVRKELGDLMLHIVFYSKIASEQNAFDINDVIQGVCDKLVSRHPHIYSDVKVESAEDVKMNWERLKLREKGGKEGVLSGVPGALPALLKALRIQQKVSGVGFDWDALGNVWGKVEEEIREFRAHFDSEKISDMDKAEDEFGDLLFCLVNYGRFLDLDAETALERTNRKFTRRFEYLEQAAKALGKPVDSLTPDEMDRFWEEAKAKERQQASP